MEVAAEGVGVLGAEVGLDTAQGAVHDGEAARGWAWVFRTGTPASQLRFMEESKEDSVRWRHQDLRIDWRASSR